MTVLRTLGLFLTGLMLAAAPAHATPDAQKPGDSITIPFEPPFGEKLRYRWETAETRRGQTDMSWSVDDYRFEQAEGGYRLTVEPVSSGSNEDDPLMLELQKRLAELTKLPFVLRLSEDAEIVELERSDEYWNKIIAALTDALKTMEPKRPGHDKMVEAVIGLYRDMTPETRLAKLTEPIQPLVEFGWTEPSLAEPIQSEIETSSPLGTIKQKVSITLTKVEDGLAHLTIRSSVPTDELKKLTTAMFERLNNGALTPDQVSTMKAQMAAARDFSVESVASYKVSTEDGMLESFQATQTITMTEKDQPERRVKTLSMKRVE